MKKETTQEAKKADAKFHSVLNSLTITFQKQSNCQISDTKIGSK